MRIAPRLVACALLALRTVAAQDAPPGPSAPAETQASDLLARGRASFQAGDTAAALAAAEAAAVIGQASDSKATLADALYLEGIVHERLGALALASAAFDRAEALEGELGNDRHLARIWNSRGLQARQLARFDEAESYFRRSLAVFASRGDKAGQSTVWGNLGLVCQNRGDFSCALEAQQRSLAIDPRNSYAIHNIAALHELQGDDALALDSYLRAAAIDHEDGDAVHEAAVLVEAGRMQMRLGREPEALAAFASARATYEKAQTPDELGDLEFALGESHLDAGRAALAVKHFEEAVRLQEPVSELHLQDSLRSLSRAQLAAKQPEAALSSARRSLEIDRRLESVSGLNESWVAVGEAQRVLGNLGEARAAYAEAIAAIESQRDLLAGDETARQRFFEGQLKPYHRLLAFAVTGGRPEEAFRLAEQARARILVDVLQHGRSIGMRLLTSEERESAMAAEAAVRALEVERAAVDDVAGPSGAEIGRRLEAARRELAATRTALFNAHSELRLARGEAEIVSPAGLAPLLEDGSAAVAFTVTEESTYAFLLTAGRSTPASPVSVGVRVVSLPVGAKEWQRRVGAFRQSLAQRDLDIAREAQNLFGDLLGPFRAEIKGSKRVYLVPDGPLWELPFAALQSSAGRYLIEDTELAMAPSLTALVAWRGRPVTPRPAGGYDLLAVGESEFGPSMQRLPAAARQTQAVASLYGSASRMLLGREANEARVKAEAVKARVLHFATHGVFEPASPLYSALLLAPEPAGSPDNGRLEAREILDLELSADLAVLSACDTARGRIGAGEGVIGLSWALSVAGVRNTVVSLWNVDAASTADLMVAFHRRVHDGAGYADALRAAALTLLRDPKTRHPFYWAPFVLIGDGLPARREPLSARDECR